MKLKILAGLIGLLPLAVPAAQEPQAGEKETETAKTIGVAKTSLCAGNDDTVALQAMLNHGNPQMTVVEIPATPTGCKISGPLIVHSNTHVIQNGLLTLSGYVWPPAGSTQRGMYTLEDGTHDVIIEGTGTLDGGHLNYAQPAAGCCMGGIVSHGSDVGSYDVHVSDITIRSLTIRNIPQWPIELDGADGVLIDGVTAHDSVNTVAVGHGSKNVIITNLRVFNIADLCLGLYRGVENAIVSNSVVNQCNGGGISAFSDWAACVEPPRFSKNVLFNNSIAYGQNLEGKGAGGFDVNGIGTEGETNESVAFTFNIAHSHASQGFGLTPVRHALLAGNMSHDQGYVDDEHPPWPAGVNLVGARGALISTNSVYDEGEFYPLGVGVYAKNRAATGEIVLNSPCVIHTVPPLPAMSIARTAVMDNYIYSSTAVPSIFTALSSGDPIPVTVAGNTYAPTGGPADTFNYATGSHNADNEAQP
jgi:hypothetical protein